MTKLILLSSFKKRKSAANMNDGRFDTVSVNLMAYRNTK